MRKLLLLAMLLCTLTAFAEETATESTQPMEVAPQYYASDNSSSFDYHEYVDAAYLNFGVLSKDEYSLGFDIGKNFFLGYDYTWGTIGEGKSEVKTKEHRISLGIRPSVTMAEIFFFQCKVGAEYVFGRKAGSKRNQIDCLIEPRLGVIFGSGGVAASYRFDVDKFHFRNTINGHICATVFFYI